MAGLPKPGEMLAARHLPVPAAFGHALGFAVLFGGTALAAYDGDESEGTAVLCGLAAILFAKFYVGVVRRIERLRDALRRPGHGQATKPDAIPRWAVVLYAMLALALACAIVVVGGGIRDAIALFVAGLAGCGTLNYPWRRRSNPDHPTAYGVIRRWLDEQAAPHGPALRRLGHALSFVLLFGGVALHALQSGFARAAAMQCGAACAAPGSVLVLAALSGVAAILFVLIYAVMAEAAQSALVDSWRHVRPGPPPQELPRWVSWPYALIGFAAFFAIAAYAAAPAAHGEAGRALMTISSRADGFRVSLGGWAMLELLLGWWIGGMALLKFFWRWRRATR